MTQELSYATSIKLEQAKITSCDGATTKDITDLVIRFDYYESVSLPTISGDLDIADSGGNIISSLPIQGLEKIELTLKDVNDKEIKYEMVVYKIYNRFSADRFQYYTLGLISKEALVNETIRVPKTLAGKPEGIVKGLLTDQLKTKKKVYTDPSSFKVRFHPGKKTPFAIIQQISTKTVSESTKSKDSGSSATTSEYSSASGSAGYYFYETKEGYHFKSIDRLNDRKENPPKKVFTQENDSIGGSAQLKISDIDFQQEIDILTKLRMGAFSSVICYYNFSTGAYEEYLYDLSKSFKDQKHLGSQTGLAKGQADLAASPTRIMSVLIDHETWFDGTEIASPEKRDGGKDGTAEFPDFQKNYISQSIARLESQNNQQVKITVPICAELSAGNTVEIQIPNQIPTSERSPDIYDPEHSGVYLIAEVNHAFDPKNAMGNTFLTLVRDSYGRPDEPSKTKTK